MENPPVESIINPRAHTTKSALKRLGIFTVKDLIEFLPFRYEDRTNVVKIKDLKFETDSVIIGRISSVSSRKSKRGVLLVQAKIKDDSGSITALWFNQRYLLKTLREQDEITLYGIKKNIPSLQNPFIVKSIISQPEICPIYHRTNGISQATIRKTISLAISSIDNLPDYLPSQIREKLNFPTRQASLIRAHQPTEVRELTVAQRLLAAEELLVLALRAEQARAKRLSQKRAPLSIEPAFLKDFVHKLPFELTESQRKSAWEILGDLQKDHPMNRLLYGEVGSGKTAVAAVVAAAVAQNKRRVAMLCPTLSLAHQQHRVLSELFLPLGYKIGVSSSAEKKDNDAPIMVGTHSLLSNKIPFDLIIIDEQHRFGVGQRQSLLNDNPTCDVLMMSATPIPRSFAQTLLRHLDITYLSQKPAHQKKVITKIFSEKSRASIELEIAERLKNGEQGYVVCPRITGDEEIVNILPDDKKSVYGELQRLKKVFPSARIGIVHGQADNAENKKVLDQFRNREIDILVATTIIEIGIDNPLATWILIETADYFGLSTLHQLRGRVGRGKKQSYCYVASSNESELAKKRLAAFSEISNGLELAEIDLELRGPGELTGYNQSGALSLKYATWSDHELLEKIFAEARKIMHDGLEMYPQLQELVMNNGELSTI